jgi:hypothetical protein
MSLLLGASEVVVVHLAVMLGELRVHAAGLCFEQVYLF